MRYRLDSMLPIRGFSPRSGRARGFAAGGMTLEGGGGEWSWNWEPSPEYGPAPAPEPAPAPAPAQDNSAAVAQMYEQILGRPPDEGGFAHNLALVNSGQISIAQLASAMAGSQEAQQNTIPAAQEQAAASNWGAPPPSAPSPTSSRAANAPSQVAQIYREILGREPDAGAQGWVDAIANGSRGVDEVRGAIGQTPEAQNYANQRYVETLYRDVLGRAPDPEGFKSNLDALNSGKASPDYVALFMANSQEAQNLAASGKTNAMSMADKATQLAQQYNSLSETNRMGGGAATNFEKPVSLYDAITGAKDVSGGAGKVFARPDGSRIYMNEEGKVAYATPPFSAYSDPSIIKKGYRNQTYSSSSMAGQETININGVDVPLFAPEYLVNERGQVLSRQDTGEPVTIWEVTPQKGPGGFDKFMQSAMPALILGTVTMGFGSLAAPIGSSILSSVGASTALAAQVGGMVVGAGTQAFLAAANGQDPLKGAITGAITGGISASVPDVLKATASWVGDGNVAAGMAKITEVAANIGQTPDQVARMVANAAGATVAASVTGAPVNLSTIGTNLASTAVGNYAGNLIKDANIDVLNSARPAITNIAKVATNAAITGQDFSTALTNNAGQIVGNLAAQGVRSSVNAIKDAANSAASDMKKVSFLQDEQGNISSVPNLTSSGIVIENPDLEQTPIGTLLDANGAVVTDPSKAEYVLATASGKTVPYQDYMAAVSGGSDRFTVDNMLPTSAQGSVTVIQMDQTELPPQGVGEKTTKGDVGPAPSAGASYVEEKDYLDRQLAAGYLDKDAYEFQMKELALQFPEQFQYEPDLSQFRPVNITQAVNQVKGLVATGVPIQEAINTAAAANNASPADVTAAVGSSTAGGTTGAGQTTTAGTGTGGGATAGGGTGAGGTGEGVGGTGTGGTGAGGTGTGGGGGSTGIGGSGGSSGTGTTRRVIRPVNYMLGAGAISRAPQLKTTTIPGVDFGPITDLTPGLTQGKPFEFVNEPTFSSEVTPMANQPLPMYPSDVFYAATGGSVDMPDLRPNLVSGKRFQLSKAPEFESDVAPQQAAMPPVKYLAPPLFAAEGGIIGYNDGGDVIPHIGGATLRGKRMRPFSPFSFAQFPEFEPKRFEEGGIVGHNPEFFSEGGLNSLENTYVKGDGDGTSDSVPAMLANGEFVIPADVVSSLGNGSNDSGAQVLDEFLKTIREHKRRADAKHLPPDSKGPLGYLLEAQRKVKKHGRSN